MPPRQRDDQGKGAGVSMPVFDPSNNTPQLWDRIHSENLQSTVHDIYPLRSAPERAVLAQTIESCRLHAGSSLTELGCGSSRFLPHLARRGVRTSGVDFSPDGVRHTQLALSRVGGDPSTIMLETIEAYVVRHEGE